MHVLGKHPQVVAEIDTNELQTLFAWVADWLAKTHGKSIEIRKDFYRTPGASKWFFDYEVTLLEENYGSFVDEIDLMRKSVLIGESDLPDVVMERVGYLLLYFAYQAESLRR
jgi:hypothetical protein